HDGETGAGGVGIDARDVAFAPGALQPADLSPLAARVASAEAQGTADFTGEILWTSEGGSSRGRLSTEGLDFVSPAGPVTRLTGRIDFVSLTPLVTAPAQRITVQRIDAFLPLAGLEAEFELDADVLRL